MIKQEIIDKAAVEYAEKKWVVAQRAVNKDGFKAGVRWVLQREFDHVKAQTDKIKFECTCDASLSGFDEAEYKARGCPECTCTRS